MDIPDRQNYLNMDKIDVITIRTPQKIKIENQYIKLCGYDFSEEYNLEDNNNKICAMHK